MGEYTSRRHGHKMTTEVYHLWYLRYAHVLPEGEQMSYQPIREQDITNERLKEAAQAPTDKTEELKKKLEEDKARKIKMVLTIIDGDKEKMNQQIKFIKPLTSPLKHMMAAEKNAKRAAALRKMAEKSRNAMFRRRVLDPKSKWRLMRENKIVMMKFKAMLLERKSARIRWQWRKSIRKVHAVLRFTNMIALLARTTSEVFKTFKQATDRGANIEQSGLCFDRGYYKATIEKVILDRDTIYTLTKPEHYRNWEEAHRAAINLRTLRSFAIMPRHFQDKLAMVGWYLEVPADKVIIREGHVPDSFYFVMSGRAIGVRLNGSPVYEKHAPFTLVRYYEKDDIFGEDGITEMSHRTVSITALDTCVLLSVNIHDYIRIFNTSMSTDENPDHIRMLSQLDFMQYFPLHILIQDAEHNIILFYFTNGSVICRRSKTSKWIYVIKTGSCQVLAEQVVGTKQSKRLTCVNYILPPISAGWEDDTELEGRVGSADSRREQAETAALINLRLSKASSSSRSSSRRSSVTSSSTSRSGSTRNGSGHRQKAPVKTLDSNQYYMKSSSAVDQVILANKNQSSVAVPGLQCCRKLTGRKKKAGLESSIVRGPLAATRRPLANSHSGRRSFSMTGQTGHQESRAGGLTSDCEGPGQEDSGNNNTSDTQTPEKRILRFKTPGIPPIITSLPLPKAALKQESGNSDRDISISAFWNHSTKDGASEMAKGVRFASSREEIKPGAISEAGEESITDVNFNQDRNTSALSVEEESISRSPATIASLGSDMTLAEDQEEDPDSIGGEAMKTIQKMNVCMRKWRMSMARGSLLMKSKDSDRDSQTSSGALQKAGSVEKLLMPRKALQKKKSVEKMLVNIRTLVEGDVFGIEDMDLGDKHEHKGVDVSLVSNGAEVIMISKEFLLTSMTPAMASHLRFCSFLLPDTEQLSNQLQKKHFWNKFRQRTIAGIYNELGISR